MESSSFYYKKSLIRRRILISGFFLATGLACLAYFGISASISTALFALVSAFYAYKLIRDVRLLSRTTPAVTVDKDGITDAHLGDTLIPWNAVSAVKVSGPIRSFGGMIVLIADTDKLSGHPGPVLAHFLNWIRRVATRNPDSQIGLPMTVTVALDTTLDDLVRAVAAHSPVAVELVGNDQGMRD